MLFQVLLKMVLLKSNDLSRYRGIVLDWAAKIYKTTISSGVLICNITISIV
jgi:hypothetical protein